MPPPMGSPEERTISYRNPSGSFMSSSSLGWMASNETAAPCPPGEPADPDEPFSSCEPPCWPPSSPSAQPTRTPEEPAARAAEPVPRNVRNLRRLIPSEGSTPRSRFSFFIFRTLGPVATRPSLLSPQDLLRHMLGSAPDLKVAAGLVLG